MKNVDCYAHSQSGEASDGLQEHAPHIINVQPDQNHGKDGVQRDYLDAGRARLLGSQTNGIQTYQRKTA